MKLAFTRLQIIIALMICLTSCQKDSDKNPSVLPPGSPITVEGIVTDVTGLPLQNVFIKAGNMQVSTDVNGSFRILGATFTTAESFVSATKPGYFKGSRTFFTREGSNHFLRIQLLKSSQVGAINSTVGGIVNFSNVTVTFPTNAFVTTNGNAYTGSVTVKAAYLSPDDSNMALQMPGDLRGLTTSGEMRGLKSFGMIKVDLEGAAGQMLNLRSGISAQISMPVPSSTANAPATVPLWYFDEGTGLWKEEGVAQKTGNRYSGTVTHFTFWNVDAPYEFVRLNMRIVNQTQQPVAGVRVKLTSLTDSTTSSDFTDNSGFVNGFVPKNAGLRRQIYNHCNQLLSSSVIGPFTSDVDLGNVQVNFLSSQQTITGTVLNCASLPMSNGHVIIAMTGHTLYANVVNGSYTVTFTSCSPGGNATITAINDSALMQSSPITISLSSPSVIVNPISACSMTSDEFYRVTVDTTTYTWTRPIHSLYFAQDSLHTAPGYSLNVGSERYGYGQTNAEFFKAPNANTVPIPITLLSFYIGDSSPPPYMMGGYTLQSFIQPPTLTQFGPVGQFVSGGFVGRFTKSSAPTPNSVMVTLSFKVRRIH